MNKHNIEEMTPHAIDAIELVSDFAGGVIPSVYHGYVASFGVSIVQVGLLPTLAFFSKGEQNEDNNDLGERERVGTMIMDILKAKHDIEGENLLRYVLDHHGEEAELTEKIKEASVALKLAMRLFKIQKGGAA